jgi:hypothetical protein
MEGDKKLELAKIALVVVPIFASSLALCYDVGSFVGLDIRFFSFFSFGEHIVFALQAIPFALPATFTLVGVLLVAWWGYKSIKAQGEQFDKWLAQATPDEIATETKRQKRKATIIWWINPWVKGFFIGLALWLVSKGNFAGAYLFLFSEVLAWLVYPVDRIASSKTLQLSLFGFVVVSAWIVAFLIGYDYSLDIRQRTSASEVITTEHQDIQANLVRGGERGVLFLAFDTKKLNFLRWEAINGIRSQ